MNWINEENLIYYLLDKGLITKTDVTIKPFWIDSFSSRNTVLAFQTETQSILLKQARQGGAHNIETLRREACVYWLAGQFPFFNALKKALPAFISYNYEEHVLLTGYLKNYQNLGTYHAQTKAFPPALAKQQGELIAAYYADLPAMVASGAVPDYFRKELPWILSTAGKPAESFQLRTKVDEYIYALLNTDEVFVKSAAALAETWQTNSLIHGDVKWANFLYREGDLRLIDWELADLGDIIWDLAGILNSYLVLWQQVYSSTSEAQVQHQISLQLEQAFAALIAGFCSKSQIAADQAFLIKLVRYTAFRLLQTSFEMGGHFSETNREIRNLIQLAKNILISPQDFLRDFLAYPHPL